MSETKKKITLKPDNHKIAKRPRPVHIVHPAIKRLWEEESRDPDLDTKKDEAEVLIPNLSVFSICKTEDGIVKPANQKTFFYSYFIIYFQNYSI